MMHNSVVVIPWPCTLEELFWNQTLECFCLLNFGWSHQLLHNSKGCSLCKKRGEISLKKKKTCRGNMWKNDKYCSCFYYLSWLHIPSVVTRLWTLCREARIRDVCRMWKPDPWPVYTESLSRPGVACSLPEVCGVQPVPGWDLHLFRPGRQNLLQKRLCKVGVGFFSPLRLQPF